MPRFAQLNCSSKESFPNENTSLQIDSTCIDWLYILENFFDPSFWQKKRHQWHQWRTSRRIWDPRSLRFRPKKSRFSQGNLAFEALNRNWETRRSWREVIQWWSSDLNASREATMWRIPPSPSFSKVVCMFRTINPQVLSHINHPKDSHYLLIFYSKEKLSSEQKKTIKKHKRESV
jgi:hypothetical protein